MEKLRHLSEALELMDELGADPAHPEDVFIAGEKVARALQEQGSFAWFWDEFGGRLLAQSWILADADARRSYDAATRASIEGYRQALRVGLSPSTIGRTIDLSEEAAVAESI